MKIDPASQWRPHEAGLKMMLAAYDRQLVSWSVATSGIENLTLIVTSDRDQIALRIWRQAKKSSAEIELELAFMDRLRQSGLPIPATLKTTTGRELLNIEFDRQSWSCLGMEYVLAPHPDRYSTKLLDQMARAQARLHLIGAGMMAERDLVADYRPLTETIFCQQLLAQTALADEVRAVAAEIEDLVITLDRRLPAGLTHLDYDRGNLLADGEQLVAILDFDDCQCRPLIMCLAYTLWDIWTSGDDTADDVLCYLRNYQRIRPLSEREFQALPQLTQFRHYVILAADLVRGSVNSEELASRLRTGRALGQWAESISN